MALPADPIKKYPVIRVSEYGTATGDEAIMNEIFARGPVAAYINAECLLSYTGGRISATAFSYFKVHFLVSKSHGF